MLSFLFATPELLFALLAIPVCAGFLLYASWRRGRAMQQLGSVLMLRKSVLVRSQMRRWKSTCMLLGLTLLAFACAGPQWGIDKDAQIRKGRDIFVVFDLSRSMLAEQPSRRTQAVRSLYHLANTLEEHGGNRIALIGFASKARLFFPLTQDIDHMRYVLKQIDTGDYPSLSTEDPVSGTRIGAAISLAASLGDPQRANRPVILLLSDGDDPANDDEWLQGIREAKAKQIRVHVVGFGEPKIAETIPFGRDVLTFDGKPIVTKLNEAVLKQIAGQTDGRYFAAQTNFIELGVYVQHLLDADELREELLDGNAAPVYQLRYAWALLPAVLVFMLTLLFNEGPAPLKATSTMNTPSTRYRARSKAFAAVAVVLAILNISAADPPNANALLRQGNAAFAAERYEEALTYYEEAEAQSWDPGLVSFNKAAALYRLERYKEAIDCYRRALEDDRAPADRKARMYFDLGNALAQHAGERSAPLAEAVANYRMCLHQANLPAKLRSDARHNLELAQLRWLKAKQEEPVSSRPETPPKKDPIEAKNPDEADAQYRPVDIEKKQKTENADDVPKGGQKSKNLRFDTHVTVLPDDVKLQAISREDALSTLYQHALRIESERLQMRNPAGPAALPTKDW